MLFGIPAGEVVFLALAIIGAGVIAGLFAGLLGIGGAAITVPVLYELFRFLDVPDTVRMQLCVGTSLAVIIPISHPLLFRASGAERDPHGCSESLGDSGGDRRSAPEA